MERLASAITEFAARPALLTGVNFFKLINCRRSLELNLCRSAAVRGSEPMRTHGGNPSGSDGDRASAGGFDGEVIGGMNHHAPS